MDFQVTTWKVQTMLQPWKMNEIGLEILKFNISVVALQEIRWHGQWQINKKIIHYFIADLKVELDSD
jgi:hypothetical protein